MNSLTLIFAFALCVVSCNCAAPKPQPPKPSAPPPKEEGYTTKFDNINLDEILNNRRILDRYMKCMLEDKQCTNEGNELKKYLPDALATSCRKCNPKQREGAIKVIKYIEKNRPEDWKKLSVKWDPEGKYFETFKKDHKDIYDEIFKN